MSPPQFLTPMLMHFLNPIKLAWSHWINGNKFDLGFVHPCTCAWTHIRIQDILRSCRIWKGALPSPLTLILMPRNGNLRLFPTSLMCALDYCKYVWNRRLGIGFISAQWAVTASFREIFAKILRQSAIYCGNILNFSNVFRPALKHCLIQALITSKTCENIFFQRFYTLHINIV